MILGITGSFGSGKTTIASMFSKYGFKVIDVDKLYRVISKPNAVIYKKIKKEFGNGIINKNKTINRNKLKKIVFKDYKKLKKLNKITHPIIINEIKKIIKNSKNKKIIIDAPLLIEAKAINLVDKIIVVKCNKNMQLKRLLKKKKYSKEEIKNIIKSQLPLREKLKYADFIIDNSFSVKKTEEQVKRILKVIMSKVMK